MFWENLSMQQFGRGAINTFLRFSLTILSALFGTIICSEVLELNYPAITQKQFLWKLVVFSWLGLILFFDLELIAERYGFTLKKRWLLFASGFAALVAYYFYLPHRLEGDHMVRYIWQIFLFGLGLHLLASFAPYFNPKTENGFWQFNEKLFLRFLTATLYSGVLFVGLCIAILAIQQLFQVNLNEKIYMRLWLFMAGVFHPWFFLAGVPKELKALETDTDYPKSLKVFTQFVLLPLVTVYLLILYGYLGKIVVQWSWPRGWVSYLVLSFSIVGIFSLLLVHPIRNTEGNTWIRTYAKWFYRALFPLLILFALAIWRRVSEYGITEERYFVLVLAFWLLSVALYFLFSKTKNIKFIPVTLCLLAFLVAFGPWGAFAVSEMSQVNRLEKLLEQNNMLVNGKLKPTGGKLTNQDRMQIVSIFDYLNRKHSLQKIRSWVPDTVKLMRVPYAGQPSSDGYDLRTIYHYLGFDKPWATEASAVAANPPAKIPLREQQYFEFQYLNKGLAKTTGYDFHTTSQIDPSYDNPIIFEIEKDTLSVERVKENSTSKCRILFWLNARDSVSVPIKPMVQRILDKNITEPTEADLSETVFLKNLKIKIVFDHISGSISKGKAYPHDYRIRLFIKLPPATASVTAD